MVDCVIKNEVDGTDLVFQLDMIIYDKRVMDFVDKNGNL